MLKACGRCKRVSFCGKECQAKAWPTHRARCSAPLAADSCGVAELNEQGKAVMRKADAALAKMGEWVNTESSGDGARSMDSEQFETERNLDKNRHLARSKNMSTNSRCAGCGRKAEAGEKLKKCE